MKKINNGFTLIELIVSIVVLAIIGMTTASFFRPAVDSYVLSRNRANLTEMADISLRNITREVQNAVPASLRVNDDSSCIEFVPSKSGGAFVATRPKDKNSVNSFATLPENDKDGTNEGEKLDILALAPNRSGDLAAFDEKTKPVSGDFIVIGAMETDEIYKDQTAIAKLKDFSETATEPGIGTFIFENKPAFSRAYDNNHFSVIDKDKKSIVYICDNASASADGKSGEGKLYKKVLKDFNSDVADSCSTSGAEIVVDGLSGCSFSYEPQVETISGVYMGYLNVNLALTQKGETINLRKGILVENLP